MLCNGAEGACDDWFARWAKLRPTVSNKARRELTIAASLCGDTSIGDGKQKVATQSIAIVSLSRRIHSRKNPVPCIGPAVVIRRRYLLYGRQNLLQKRILLITIVSNT